MEEKEKYDMIILYSRVMEAPNPQVSDAKF
jgi:hypothetical protein